MFRKRHSIADRVLDVCSDTYTGPKLIESHGIKGKYAALSHTWGKEQDRFMTTTANIQAHKESIDVQHMPKVFQDAVRLMRKFQLRYIWIDAV